MIQEMSERFNTLQDVRDFMHDQLSKMDLQFTTPPFITQYYHPLRRQVFKNYVPLLTTKEKFERNDHIYHLAQIVDEEMFNHFQAFLRKPYQELISAKHYGVPHQIDLDKQYKGMTLTAIQTLIANMAEWNIQIEKTQDSVIRIQLYQLWTPEDYEKDTTLSTKLKSLLHPNGEFDYKHFAKNIVLHLLAQGAAKCGNYLKDKVLSSENLTQGAMVIAFQAYMGSHMIPWQALLNAANIKLLCGGMMGYFMLGKMADYINQTNEYEEIMQFAKEFEKLSHSLVNLNEKITSMVNDCLLAIDEESLAEKKQDLSNLIEAFLNNPEIVKYGEIIINNDVVEKLDNGWLVVDQKQKKQ